MSRRTLETLRLVRASTHHGAPTLCSIISRSCRTREGSSSPCVRSTTRCRGRLSEGISPIEWLVAAVYAAPEDLADADVEELVLCAGVTRREATQVIEALS